MKLTDKLKHVRDILLEVSDNLYHYRYPTDEEKKSLGHWLVWQEDSENNALHADNSKGEQSLHGTIDLYTLIEYDALIDDIQDVLNKSPYIIWRLNSVSYEDDTNLIHYEWELEIG